MTPGPYTARKGNNVLEVLIKDSFGLGWVTCGDIGIANVKALMADGWTFTPRIQVPQGAWAVVVDDIKRHYIRWGEACEKPWLDAWAKAYSDSDIASILANGGRVVREGI
jgi:hypothetical protein